MGVARIGVAWVGIVRFDVIWIRVLGKGCRMMVRSEKKPEAERADEAGDNLPLVIGSLLVAAVWMWLFLWLA